ncbi:23S rRNA (uracil1939-C5)-methyltransferase [Bartonella sp. JB63]|nr:23S rRNA (uracil1939-C5)-methyltransferase [Bartonella sp. JB15]AQX28979.1 23S rRNA (uracil1939-C5)-methyltransferase [Bartonella sp. JB63]
MKNDVIIDHIGMNGHGIAKTAYGSISVPFTLPREIINVTLNGKYGTLITLKKITRTY